MPPRCRFRFCCSSYIFIGQRYTHKARVKLLCIPEARVGVSVQDCDGAVWLAAQRVGVQPQGFQCFCVECLNPSIGQTNQHNAIRIGRPVDGKAGFPGHLTRGLHCAGVLIYAVNMVACIDNQAIVHQNRVADGSVGVALSQLHCPVHHAAFCCDRRFGVCNAIVAVHTAAYGASSIRCTAEIRPFGVQIVLNFLVFFCNVQFDLDSMKIRESFFSEFQHDLSIFILFQRQFCLLTAIAHTGKACSIGEALRERIGFPCAWPAAISADALIDINLAIRGGHFKGNCRGSSFLNLNSVNGFCGLVIAVCQFDGEKLRLFTAIQFCGKCSA